MVLEDLAHSNVQEERESKKKPRKKGMKQQRGMVQPLEVIREGGGWSQVEQCQGEEELYNKTHVH